MGRSPVHGQRKMPNQGLRHRRTRAARLLATAGQTGRVDPPAFGIGALMVGDKANGPRLGRDSRVDGGRRRMHSVCVGGDMAVTRQSCIEARA